MLGILVSTLGLFKLFRMWTEKKSALAVLGERITGVDRAVVKLSVQIERLDSKQREIELAQARMLAAN